MLYIWWDWKGVLYYELLLENQTVNSNKYCSQLDQLKAALDEKCPELVNRLHISGQHKTTCFFDDQAETVTAWLENSDSSACSPDTVASDVYLVCAYKILLVEKKIQFPEDYKSHLEQFFAQKDRKFWGDGIMNLPEKWQKVVEHPVIGLPNEVLGENEKCVFCL